MNILILMADEFRRDAAGFSGNLTARTPCLDRLAADAMVFPNACTPSPVCVPARQCLATGKYPFRIGCEGFHTDLPPGSETFARHFSEHGYLTVACGKLHHRGPDQMQGWMQRIGSEQAVRWPEKFGQRSQIGRRPWQGAADVTAAGPGVSPLALHDDLTVQGACDFVRMHFGGMYPHAADVPVLLMVSLQQPHFPLLCDGELFPHHLAAAHRPDIPGPPLHPLIGRGVSGVSEEAVRRARAAYAAMVEATDRRFARVVRTLEEHGQDLDDWLVVFTSDHGDLLGDHGCWEKRSFYEQSVGVPLFVRGKGFEPGTNPRLASLVDIFPTLCHAAGLAVPTGLDGRDLHEPREEVFSQYGRTHFMLRRGQWKFLTYGGEAADVLFDLASDPLELRNLVEAEPHVAGEMRERLDQILRGRPQMA